METAGFVRRGRRAGLCPVLRGVTLVRKDTVSSWGISKTGDGRDRRVPHGLSARPVSVFGIPYRTADLSLFALTEVEFSYGDQSSVVAKFSSS